MYVQVFSRGKLSLATTCRMWQACANIHNIAINKRKDLVAVWESEMTEAARLREKRLHFNGTPDATYTCPVEHTEMLDKAEGDRRQRTLVERAEAREDLIVFRTPRAERGERLQQRRVVDHELKRADSDDY